MPLTDKQARLARRAKNLAAGQYEAAQQIAHQGGLVLSQDSRSRYSLHDPQKGWTLLLFPKNGRVTLDGGDHAPFIRVTAKNWDLIKIVREAISLNATKERQ